MTEKATTDKDETAGGTPGKGERDDAGEASSGIPTEEDGADARGGRPGEGADGPGPEGHSDEGPDANPGGADTYGGAGGDAVPEEPEPDPGGAPPATHSPETVEEALAEEELTRALDELQEEFQELNDRHLRLAAEFTNYRRRQEAEMTQAWGRAQSDLVRRFLDVLDDLQRVSGLDPADDAVSVESIVEGVDLVERKFLRTLEDAGVEVVEPEGEPFDPETMEAMMRVPAESEDADDTVAQVFQKGYVLKGHLVRPARVSVYKAE